MENKPELLMPAGDLEKLKYAFAYGADAVYAGVPMYSLRARENGFDVDSLREGIDYAHNLGKRIYLTMNIYAHNSKVDRFLDSFCEMSDLAPDGFIMSDAGLIVKSLKLRPGAIIHLSTQANVTNWATAQFWRDVGVQRIILSRELSIREIDKIHKEASDIELEAFVHGAVCVAYSGRCMISNYLSYRDANQGTCTNSCRWEYRLSVQQGSLSSNQSVEVENEEYVPIVGNYVVTEKQRSRGCEVSEPFEIDEDEFGTYLMNSKDLCAIELLEQLCAAGVSSLKVEGRSKSIYYVASIARAYRRAIDDLAKGRSFNPEHLKEAACTSNRTLMTGFLLRRPKEYGMNFEDGWSKPLTHRFAGQVVDYDSHQGIAWVDFKNRVETGSTLEWMTPTETTIAQVGKILKMNGEVCDCAHGGLRFGIEVPFEPDSFTILRQPVEIVKSNEAFAR